MRFQESEIGGTLFVKRNYAFAKESVHTTSVIARSETTKQSVLNGQEIVANSRPRNEDHILSQVNNSENSFTDAISHI